MNISFYINIFCSLDCKAKSAHVDEIIYNSKDRITKILKICDIIPGIFFFFEIVNIGSKLAIYSVGMANLFVFTCQIKYFS